MTEKKQFDLFLGGSQSLPHEVPIMKVVAARASEISAMTYSIENPERTKLVFQKLPVYMRRRVMSHNVKRLPRRLRIAHLSQMAKSGLPPKSKRPSRKYRRRPSNLLSEYNRRQRNKVWLETHIWHAKRFHMIDKWGYRIASHPNDKCFRANYRAVVEHCLLQDVSYYTCVEINGREDLLRVTLKMHCNPSALSFTAKKYTNGRIEGTTMFFRKNGYPHLPIGNVHFFWRPSETDIKTVWIWVHPAFYTDFLSEITSSFGFKENSNGKDETNAKNNSIPSYMNDDGCKMIILKYALNRFRLHGPLSLNILTESLHLSSLTELDLCSETECLARREQEDLSNNGKSDTSETSVESNTPQSVEKMQIDRTSEANNVVPRKMSIQELRHRTWHIEYYKNQENMKAFKMQRQLWQELRTTPLSHRLPTHIIGLTVLDPRFYFPTKRTKSKTEIASSRSVSVPAGANRTAIWDAQIRRTVSGSCVPTSSITELRSECLVPGVANDQYYNQDVMAKIPILLIPRHGNDTGVGTGMDIILPSRWAMPFWLAFTQRCSRVGALRESRSIAFESLCQDTSDINDPDCPAYTREALNMKEELTKKYFRYPPNKRINFTKFGISSPFFCDWKNLMKGWSDVDDFYVLRDLEFLLFLQESICPQSSSKNKNRNYLFARTRQIDIRSLNEYKNCLVRIEVSMMGKGSPKEFAIVCMPTSDDLEKLRNDSRWTGPVEKCHADLNENSRRVSRKSHLMLLKRLRRQRVRQRKLETSVTLKKCMEQLKSSSHSEIISTQAEKMSKLYLPECTEVRYSCDREVMGYLTIGHFSFFHAKGIGIGYVALQSLIEMINKKSNVVLVRNIGTRQYRLATLNILEF